MLQRHRHGCGVPRAQGVQGALLVVTEWFAPAGLELRHSAAAGSCWQGWVVGKRVWMRENLPVGGLC